MLRDLTIQNYRCFEDFHMDGLERVNLFVGNNNSGKTSLLEAIYLLVNSDRREALLETINNRSDYFITDNPFFYSIRHLFYQHQLQKKTIEIKSSNSKEKHLIIGLSYPRSKATDLGEPIPYLECFEVRKIVNNRSNNEKITRYQKQLNKTLAIIIENKEYIKIDNQYKNQKYVEIKTNINNDIFVSVNKLFFEQIALMWDTIVLTSKEAKIIEALKIIENSLERISFSSSSNANSIRLKLENVETPIPLSSMGEGMYRILVLAMSLVTAEGGVLLVDEIETGLHYEAQTDMWRLILETAKELNVQVFATTHSWDCIAAYQEALSQVEDSSIGKLFRLDSKYGKLRAVEYDAEDLEVVTREGIEVR